MQSWKWCTGAWIGRGATVYRDETALAIDRAGGEEDPTLPPRDDGGADRAILRELLADAGALMSPGT